MFKKPSHVFGTDICDVTITRQAKSLNAPDADVIPLRFIFGTSTPVDGHRIFKSGFTQDRFSGYTCRTRLCHPAHSTSDCL